MTATPAPNLYTTPHISHPTLPLPLTHLHRLHSIIQSAQDQTMPHRVIFHHIHITALSALVPSDRTLKLSLDNTVHTLTPLRTGNVATPHHLHLYLNPHGRLPHLQHTCAGSNLNSHCLIITTSLPRPCSGFSSARRLPMMRTTGHAPAPVTTLTFPADSTQHQQSILPLATHLLLTVPVIAPHQSWNIIHEKETHRHTLQLIMATVTLKRHHLVWYTTLPDPSATHTTHRLPQDNLSNIPKRRAVPTPTHHPTKQQRRTRS